MSIALVYAAESYHTKGAPKTRCWRHSTKEQSDSRGHDYDGLLGIYDRELGHANKAFDKCKDKKLYVYCP